LRASQPACRNRVRSQWDVSPSDATIQQREQRPAFPGRGVRKRNESANQWGSRQVLDVILVGRQRVLWRLKWSGWAIDRKTGLRLARVVE